MLIKNSTRSNEDQKITKISFEKESKEIVDMAFKIHQTLGAGMLECIYEDAFVVELEKRKIPFEKQKMVPVFYEGVKLPSYLKLDLIVYDKFVIELKSQKDITDVHTAQILTYMRTAQFKSGFIINFGEPYFKKAIKRFVL